MYDINDYFDLYKQLMLYNAWEVIDLSFYVVQLHDSYTTAYGHR